MFFGVLSEIWWERWGTSSAYAIWGHWDVPDLKLAEMPYAILWL